jgi:hypothetical protein
VRVLIPEEFVLAGALMPPNTPAIMSQRTVVAFQAPFHKEGGTGSIAGLATRADGGVASLVILHLRSGHMIATAVPTVGTGAYRFDKLAAGEYVVSLFDGAGIYKSETIHATVP